MANQIDSTCLIDANVELGENNVLLPYTILKGPLKIGNDNIIGPHVVIGSPGQDTKNPRYDSRQKQITIGSGNIIREFSAIQKPCHTTHTQIGNNVYFMQSVHIPHDAVIEDDVVLTPMVALGGHVKLLRAANIGLGVTIHQQTVVGAYTMVGMGATVTKNIKPFAKYIPKRPLSVNTYALEKFHLMQYQDEITAYVTQGRPPTSAAVCQVVERYELLHAQSKRDEY